LSSGEGLIHVVRDPVRSLVRGEDGKRTEKEVDPGVSDKRALIIETEFARALEQSKREGNVLSAVMRDAWDGRRLSTLTKNSAETATDAHISIVGHITNNELNAKLDQTSIGNGFINRFLLVCARRSKSLPDGGGMVPDATVGDWAHSLSSAVQKARSFGRVSMDDEAKRQWHEVYPVLSAGEPGLLGQVIGRAEAHATRLALLYALAEGSSQISHLHLEAALAVWTYCEASARYLFPNSTGDHLADNLLDNLRDAGDAGLTKTEIRRAFSHGSNRQQHIPRALFILRQRGLARCVETPAGRTGGRRTERWFATE
jgi:hypothetical protein